MLGGCWLAQQYLHLTDRIAHRYKVYSVTNPKPNPEAFIS